MCLEWRTCRLKMWCEPSVSRPSHSDVLERWQLDVSARLHSDDTVNQPAAGLCWSTRGDWAGRKPTLKWKRCHSDLTQNTSHSTDGSDFSQVRCYTLMRLKISVMVLLRSITQWTQRAVASCLQVLHKTGEKAAKQRDRSRCPEREKTHKSYYSKPPRVHVNVSLSFPEVSHVSFVIEMWKLQLCLNVLLCLKKKEYAKKQFLYRWIASPCCSSS